MRRDVSEVSARAKRYADEVESLTAVAAKHEAESQELRQQKDDIESAYTNLYSSHKALKSQFDQRTTTCEGDVQKFQSLMQVQEAEVAKIEAEHEELKSKLQEVERDFERERTEGSLGGENEGPCGWGWAGGKYLCDVGKYR